MRKWIICWLVCVVFTPSIFSQIEEKAYDIKALGQNIGEIRITRTIKGDKVYLENLTHISVNLLIKKIEMKVVNRVQYQKGQLMSTYNRVVVNGEPHSSTDIQWQDHAYRITIDSVARPNYEEPVFFSGSLLYFHEPIHQKRAFSEASGIMMPIEKLKENTYQITDPDTEREMVRYYEDGELVLTKIKHPILTINIRKKDS